MRSALLTVSLLLMAVPLHGQAPPAPPAQPPRAAVPAIPCPEPSDPSQVDRIAAVVGDSVILLSQLQQECKLANQRNLDPNQPPITFTVDELLDNLVNIQVLLVHAAKDSTVIPSAQELTARVNAQIESARGQFPNEQAFQQALSQQGLTLISYTDVLTSRIRTEMIRQAFTQRLLQAAPTPVVSEAEMRAFYDQAKDQLQSLPELLTVQQVLMRAGASDSAWARAQQKADSLYALAIRGVDFAQLATENSQDPGSKDKGGDIGAISRGGTVPEFDRAAFSLRDGAISAPVRTEYGYHIIKVERTARSQKFVRHILIQPDSDPSDLERTRALGQDIVNRIRAGESTLRLAQQYGDPAIPREIKVPRGQEGDAMPAPLAERLVGAKQGDVIGPFDANLTGLQYVAVLYVPVVRSPGQATFEEVRDQIRDLLVDRKRQERIYQKLRDKTFVEVRYGR